MRSPLAIRWYTQSPRFGQIDDIQKQTSFIIHKNELILKLKEMVDEICSRNTQKALLPLYQKINTLLANNLDTEDDWRMSTF